MLHLIHLAGIKSQLGTESPFKLVKQYQLFLAKSLVSAQRQQMWHVERLPRQQGLSKWWPQPVAIPQRQKIDWVP